MGMFDLLICSHPLPGIIPEYVKDDHKFQTKDFDCVMEDYIIDEDGKLSDPDFTGEIEFYTSNITGSGPAIYTSHGEDAESVGYKAQFCSGILKDLKQDYYKRVPAFPSNRQTFHIEYHCRSEDAVNDSHLGKTLYLSWGGTPVEDGNYVEIIEENSKQLVAKLPNGTYELLYRFSLGATLFIDKEDAVNLHNAKQQNWELRKKEYEDYCKSKQEKQ